MNGKSSAPSFFTSHLSYIMNVYEMQYPILIDAFIVVVCFVCIVIAI